MKKRYISILFAFLLVLLNGCLSTLHPIFTEKDLAYNPKLLGSWKMATDEKNNGSLTMKGTATITNLATEKSVTLPGNLSSIKQKGYLVTYRDENGNITEQYIAFLARIGKHLYFDYYPADIKEEKKLDEFFTAHFIKMHTSYRVDLIKDGGFQLSQLDQDYVNKLIEEKKIRIRHEKDEDGNIGVITASTQELQQYLIKYGDDPHAYRKEKTIFRK
jgi:hypothetical protein